MKPALFSGQRWVNKTFSCMAIMLVYVDQSDGGGSIWMRLQVLDENNPHVLPNVPTFLSDEDMLEALLESGYEPDGEYAVTKVAEKNDCSELRGKCVDDSPELIT